MQNMIIAIGVTIIAALFMFKDAPQSPVSAAPNTAQEAGAKAKAYSLNSTDKTFKYKVDARRFDQIPNTAAIEENWSAEQDIMVLVKPDNPRLRPFYIDAYEAVISNHRAWSVPKQFPTDKLRFSDASIACEAANKRLCSIYEWQTACRGGRTKPIAFNRPDQLIKLCDFARSNTYDRMDFIELTDSHPKCLTPGLPLHHMMGNVSEFVTGPKGETMVAGLTYYDGKIRDKAGALRKACERIVAGPGQYPENRFNKGLGFRCCRDVQ